MDRVTSKDGTSIAYEHDGRGPAVILVGGAIDDGPPPAARIARITQPTLVATGGGIPDSHAGGLPAGFMDRAADAIAASIPLGYRRIIDGGGHMVDAKLVAPVLERFFGG